VMVLLFRLHYTFQDQDYLYMCMDLASGGELREVINRAVEANKKKGIQDHACDIATARFYVGELIEALEYLHKLNIVHMDIKPESTYNHLIVTFLHLIWLCSVCRYIGYALGPYQDSGLRDCITQSGGQRSRIDICRDG
jgi:hypothetical protein